MSNSDSSENHEPTLGRAIDPGQWVDQHGDALFRYALSRLRDRPAAEDLVQETFLAALKAKERFRGDSTPRTWLVGVLRHKIVDHYRRVERKRRIEEDEASHAEPCNAFDERGHWTHPPKAWDPVAPRGNTERTEFWNAVDKCVDGVPGRAGEAFTLRVLCGLSSEEVCQVLSVKATNLWVLLHRARRRLRECLEASWFRTGENEGAA